jgi:hypothetical protein
MGCLSDGRVFVPHIGHDTANDRLARIQTDPDLHIDAKTAAKVSCVVFNLNP